MCSHNLTMKFPPDFHNYTGLNGLVSSFSLFTIAPPNKLLDVLQKSFPKKFTKKCLCYSLFLILLKELQAVRFATLLKRQPCSGVSEPAVCRSSTKQLFLNNSQNSQGNTFVGVTFLRTPCFTEHLQWLLLKVSGFQPATLLKNRLRQKCFSVNFAKF